MSDFLFGVGGVVLDWFKSYLYNRYQCIKIGSVLSNAKRLLHGMPQDFALGPILISLYTTPIPLAKIFKIILAYISTFMQMISSYMFI